MLALAIATQIVIDFTAKAEPTRVQLGHTESVALLTRFPHPHAKPGAACDPNYPNTPKGERTGGTLMPTITKHEATITRRGATQTAYLIDYCPTNNGVPRTRRLIVLDGTQVAIDRELSAALPASEVLAAPDIDGDGLGELLLTDNVYRNGRQTVTAYLVKRDMKLLGSWTVREHCVPGEFREEEIVHQITVDARGGFKDVAKTRHCYYPPAPPR